MRTSRVVGRAGVVLGEEPAEPDPTATVSGRRDPVGLARIPGGDHQAPRAVRLVPHLAAVEGDPLVVVVVGVEELVPQADVPEGARRRRAFEHQCLVLVECVAAHGVGGVAGGPPEGLGGHRVGLVDRVGGPEGDRDDPGLVAYPGQGGPQPPGQVGIVLPPGGRRIHRLDVPLGPHPVVRIGQVVAGDGAHRVGLELHPRPVVGVRAEHDRKGPVIGDVEHLVVDRTDDALRVPPVRRARRRR